MNKEKGERRRLYVLPGLGETTDDRGYRDIIFHAKAIGYEVFPISIDWGKPLMSDFIEQCDSTIRRNGHDQFTVVGFSFGAFIASVLAEKYDFKKLILCSISPYFREDIDMAPKETAEVLKQWKGKKVDDLRKYSFPSNITCAVTLLVGNQEWDITKDRMKRAYDSCKGAKEMVMIDGADHDISQAAYFEAVKRLL